MLMALSQYAFQLSLPDVLLFKGWTWAGAQGLGGQANINCRRYTEHRGMVCIMPE